MFGGGGIYRWLPLCQEYDLEVTVKPGRLNAGLDHLSQIENGEEPTNIKEGLPDVKLFVVKVVDENFADIIRFLSTNVAPKGYTMYQRKELVVRATNFSVIVGQLYKMGSNEVIH